MRGFIPHAVNFIVWFLIGMGSAKLWFFLRDRRGK